MNERKIVPVKSNTEKQRSYAEQMRRYKAAVKEGFFFEAMLIDYAMLEDRLFSMIYHMAFIHDRDTAKLWKKTKPFLNEMMCRNKDEAAVSVTKISGKIRIVRAVMNWVCEAEDGYKEVRYLSVLKDQCEGLDAGGILSTLSEIEEWCAYRNEVIHSLLNKNVDSVNEKMKDLSVKGMEYARFLDSQVRLLKKGNRVRRSINASVDKK